MDGQRRRILVGVRVPGKLFWSLKNTELGVVVSGTVYVQLRDDTGESAELCRQTLDFLYLSRVHTHIS